jgi:phospholipid/cholesterol/gamma-HCH transport system substrate-binding protein
MNRTYIGLGAFVVVSVGLLLYLAQSIGAIGAGGGARYELRLRHAAGLVENNAVKIAGVGVGRVAHIDVDHDIAVLTLRVDEDIVLHEDARAIVRAKSLLGEKYLQIHPGTREAPVLASGGVIKDVDAPFEIDEVLNALEPVLGGEDNIAASLAPLAKTLSDLLNDAAGKNGKPAVISREEIRGMVEDLKASTAAGRRILEENEQGIGELVVESNKLAKRGNRLLADARIERVLTRADSMTKTLDEKLPSLLERSESAIAKLEKLADVVDDDRARKLKTIIDDASVATKNLRKISSDLSDVGGVLDPLAKDLATIAKRAAAIDEKIIRKFVQEQGIKVFVGSKREAQKLLKEE